MFAGNKGDSIGDKGSPSAEWQNLEIYAKFLDTSYISSPQLLFLIEFFLSYVFAFTT